MGMKISKESLRGFEEALVRGEKSSATVEKYIRDVRAFGRYAGGREICKELVLDYKESLRERYSVLSANSMLAALNAYFRFCGRAELCVKQFKVQQRAFCSAERELSKEEYRRLIVAAERKGDRRLALLIQTVCGTGIRISELPYITVEAAKRGRATVSCKGKVRTVFIVTALQKKLLRYAKEKGIRAGEIFVSSRGRSLDRSNVWREMKALCKSAGVHPSKVFPHNLRHLFARSFYALEHDIAKLADVLGHSNINTTRIYIVTTGEEHRRHMELLRLIT